MPLPPGTRLGAFEVSALIGEGGMGQVYRARDTRLGREVAVKVLPEAVENDPERVARFEREAKSLAALNHPNIAMLLGLELAGTRHLLVMELVEGETLADLLQRGPVPADAAMPIARQIAEAIESAHESGIVHRDLKPANVKVTAEGTIKVLDFGLAKALDSGPVGSPHISQSPTLSVMATAAGMILGTAAYMSPEQAKGLPADHRSDIFAFGALYYELLTGAKAFPGETVHDILASVIAREPDWSALPATIHPRLKQLLQRCLVKSRRQRWQAIGDVRAELEMIAADPTGGVTAPMAAAIAAPSLPLWRRAVPVVAGALAATIVLGVAAWSRRPALVPLPVARFEIASPTSGLYGTALTPDGSAIVSIGFDRLWLRSLSAVDMRPIAGTEGRAFGVAVSSDGRSIAFVQGPALKTVQLEGGAPVTIGRIPTPVFGISWDESGILVGLGPGGIARLPAHGGQQEQLVAVADGEHASQPRMLPGNKAVLFTLAKGTPPDWLAAQVVAQRLGSTERHVVATVGSDARYLRTGHIAFAVDGVWMAAPFDLDTLSATAAPVPMVEGVARENQAGLLGPGVMLALSDTGTLAYVPGPASTAVRGGTIVLTDRAGRNQPLAMPDAPYEGPRVSPNGKQLAVGTDDGREAAVWIYDLSGASAIRKLTFSGRNRVPVWSPDGQRVAFQSDREGDTAIFSQRADGTGGAERITKAEPGTEHVPESWSSDGRYLSFSAVTGGHADLWIYDFREKQAQPFGDVRGTGPANSQFSPDGRWIAYSARGDSSSVFVQPVPATGARYQASAMRDTGHHPFWAPNGKELFYFGVGGNSLMAAPITLASSPTIGVSARVAGSQVSNTTARGVLNYDVTPDEKFFVRTFNQAAIANLDFVTMRVVLNWFEELKQRVPK